MPHESRAVTVETPTRLRRVALAGNPNVGKTTVFNLLTGMHQKVGNYPGVTVEKKVGRMVGASPVEIVDLPGTYSLNPASLDEQVAYDVLAGRVPGEAQPDLVVCIVDATNLERNLYLASQVMDLGLPTVLVLNMMDEAEANGLTIDVDALSRALGVPILPMTATRRDGLAALKEAITGPAPAPPARQWTLMPAVDVQVEVLMETLAATEPGLDAAQRFSEALRALTNDAVLDARRGRNPAFYEAVHEARKVLDERRVPYRQAETIGRYGWLSPLASRVVSRKAATAERTRSDRIDAVLTHRIAGPVIFLGVLLLIFQAVFSWATPAMDLIEYGVAALGEGVRAVFPPGVFTDLLVDGVIAGVGAVVVFLPQILLLFFFLGLMEDTGYMARTAFIMDRVMRRVGLSGGSVVPLLSSFACAIPGIMAARTLDNHRDRVVTIMVAPLMSCSARLPVYTLFIAAFIPAGTLFGLVGFQGLAMFSMYLLGTVMAFVAAWVLKRFVFKGTGSYFVMELPPYRLPQMKLVFWRMIERAKAFVVRAGKIIFAMSIVLWFLASFPRVEPSPELQAEEARAEAAYAQAVDRIATARGTTAAALLEEPIVTEVLALAEARAAAATPEAVAAVEEALAALRARRPGAVESALALHEAEQQRASAERRLANLEAGYQIRHSFIGWIGRTLEPVMAPLGFDWKLSAGIVSAFAAREVIIATLATLYSVGEADETSVDLQEALKADRDPETGRLVYTPLVAVSLLVFFVLALQCMSTLAIARRELDSWFWPAVMWAYMTGLAYLFSLIVYQGGQLLGLQ